jgi:hypothetical protein
MIPLQILLNTESATCRPNLFDRLFDQLLVWSVVEPYTHNSLFFQLLRLARPRLKENKVGVLYSANRQATHLVVW